ncbi:MAG TPA: Gfo/Idh/MocA family oxidoreductase [Candidatus Acidoferrum sp.]|nr:Gfo/Idh/MocA family oxidoreductase [Candidatus Acidoferrum sp.]
MGKRILVTCAALCAAILFMNIDTSAQEKPPVRVAIVGLVHGHVGSLFEMLPQHPDVKLVSIYEPQKPLAEQYAKSFHILETVPVYNDLEKMLTEQKPDAVLVYSTIVDHRKIIEAAARHGISSMVEKPLATTLEDALAIRKAAREHHVQVLTNYFITWQPNSLELFDVAGKGKLGDLRRIIAHTGHRGPKEIGVGPEWLPWLTDPVQNGGGALFDFGCYGADFSTVLMHGQAPISVTAIAQTEKPDVYPKVDDEATVILRYAKAQTVLMPSWNWPYSRNDIEVYGATGYAAAVGADSLRFRYAGEKAESTTKSPAPPKALSNSLDYLVGVLHGETKPNGDPSSLETNVTVVQILDAARKSAQTGKTIVLEKLPD